MIVQMMRTANNPSTGRTSSSKRNFFMVGSTLQIANGKALGVSLRFGGIVRHTIEERFDVVVQATMGVADFLHRFFVEIGAHDTFGDAIIVGSSGDQAPAAILREKPFSVFWLGIIAVSRAEIHIMIVFLRPPVAVVIMSLQPAEDGFLWAIDIGWARDALALFRSVLQLVEPDTGLVQGFENGLHRLRIFFGKLLGKCADLFRVILPHVFGGDRSVADAIDN